MALELVGKLQQLLPLQSGTNARGGWTKQDFVIETEEQYPRKVCISAWGDKARDLDGIAIGESIRVSVNVESREYNGKWYTDVRSWRIQRENDGQQAPPPAANAPTPANGDDFGYLGASEEVDDLPF